MYNCVLFVVVGDFTVFLIFFFYHGIHGIYKKVARVACIHPSKQEVFVLKISLDLSHQQKLDKICFLFFFNSILSFHHHHQAQKLYIIFKSQYFFREIDFSRKNQLNNCSVALLTSQLHELKATLAAFSSTPISLRLFIFES